MDLNETQAPGTCVFKNRGTNRCGSMSALGERAAGELYDRQTGFVRMPAAKRVCPSRWRSEKIPSCRESLDKSPDAPHRSSSGQSPLRPHGQPVILVVAQASVWMTLMVGHGGQHGRLVISTPQGKVNGWEAKAFLKKQTASGAPIGRNHWVIYSRLSGLLEHT